MFTRKPSASHNEQPNQTGNLSAFAGQIVLSQGNLRLRTAESRLQAILLACWGGQPFADNPAKKLTNSNAIENCLPDQIIRKQQQCQKSHREYNDHRSSVKLSFGRP